MAMIVLVVYCASNMRKGILMRWVGSWRLESPAVVKKMEREGRE